MSKPHAVIFGILALCSVGVGCKSASSQANQVVERIREPRDLSVVLSIATDRLETLIVIVKNDGEDRRHISEIQEGKPCLTLHVAQGERDIKLQSHLQWNIMTKSLIVPLEKEILPHTLTQFSLDLATDYTDAPEPEGKTVYRLNFDPGKPVSVWVTMPNPDQGGATTERVSDRIRWKRS